MKTTAAVFVLMLNVSVFLYPQIGVIPDDWETNHPWDTETYKYGIGVSGPKNNEGEAITEAENLATVSLAGKIWMLVVSRYSGTIYQDGPQIREESTVSSYIVSRLVLKNTSRIFTTKKTGDKFIAHSLAYINRVDADQAVLWAMNELASLYAYNFFSTKIPGLKTFDITKTPEGFGDYHTWVLANCGILSIHGSNRAYHLSQLETFVKIIFPDCITFASNYNGEPARFIYNSDRLDVISQVLQRHGINVLRQHPMLTVSGSVKLGELAKKNPSAVYVSGVEKIPGIFAGELVRQLQNAGKKNVTFFPLPPGLNGFSETAALEFIRNKSDLPSRYVLIYTTETFIEPENKAFNISPYLFAQARVVVYDTVFGEILFSDTIKNCLPVTDERALMKTSDLLLRRLPNTAFVEAVSNSMRVRNGF
jgi:hypothetical protein